MYFYVRDLCTQVVGIQLDRNEEKKTKRPRSLNLLADNIEEFTHMKLIKLQT